MVMNVKSTLVTGCELTSKCGFIPARTPRRLEALEAARCRRPTAYLVTSKVSAWRGLLWEVCVDHAADARQMEWLESIRSV